MPLFPILINTRRAMNTEVAAGEMTDVDAIEMAMGYLSDRSKYLDDAFSFRLESVRKKKNQWEIVVSFLTASKRSEIPNPLLQALNNRRLFKLVVIDAKKATVLHMADPESE